MPLLEWLKAVPTPLAGTAYEPWVQLLQFLLVVAVTVSAMAWVLTRRHVITVAHWIWPLVVQADDALKRASRYAPATEHRLARREPYVVLVVFWFMGVIDTFFWVLSVIGVMVFFARGMWGWAVCTALFMGWFLIRARLDWVAVSWARHSLATGEEFTWPQCRAS